eukprot:scaffold227065_cov13-Tisochrysis_lutea.AAC.1
MRQCLHLGAAAAAPASTPPTVGELASAASRCSPLSLLSHLLLGYISAPAAPRTSAASSLAACAPAPVVAAVPVGLDTLVVPVAVAADAPADAL